jgi:hypothetical protein
MMWPSILNAKETKECTKKYAKKEICPSKLMNNFKLRLLEEAEEELK